MTIAELGGALGIYVLGFLHGGMRARALAGEVARLDKRLAESEAHYEEKVTALEERMAALEERLLSSQQELERLRAENGALSRRVARLQEENATLRDALCTCPTVDHGHAIPHGTGAALSGEEERR